MFGLFKSKKQKMKEECWDLNIAGIQWLRERLPLYLEDAGKIVDLDYKGMLFEYNGLSFTHREMLEGLVNMIEDYFYVGVKAWYELEHPNGFLIDAETYYMQEIWNVWAIIAIATWW